MFFICKIIVFEPKTQKNISSFSKQICPKTKIHIIPLLLPFPSNKKKLKSQDIKLRKPDSLIDLADECCSSHDPVVAFDVAFEVEAGDVVGGVAGGGDHARPEVRLVNRAAVSLRAVVLRN